MDEEQLKQRVDEIISVGIDDDERAHSEEDELHRNLIGQFCPEWVKEQIERLDEADFARWCA